MGDAAKIPAVGRYEAAHGTQKAQGKELTFVAVPDGVRPAVPVSAVPQPAPNGKQFNSKTGRAAAHVRWRRYRERQGTPDFAEREMQIVPTEAFQPFEQARQFGVTRKLEELRTMVGIDHTPGASLGAGVTAVVRGWAWMLSFAEFYATRAAQTGSADDAERARKFFKDASIELAKAHELARAEAAARPKQSQTARVIASLGAGAKEGT